MPGWHIIAVYSHSAASADAAKNEAQELLAAEGDMREMTWEQSGDDLWLDTMGWWQIQTWDVDATADD